MKLVILSILVCLMAAAQSIHVHPNGRELVFTLGTNSVTTDRRQCWGRIHKFQSELDGLRGQLDWAQKCVRDYPPRITVIEQELETLRLHLKMMDLMMVTNTPSAPVVMPPMPGELPVNASVRSGLPAAYRPEFVPRRDVMTARE